MYFGPLNPGLVLVNVLFDRNSCSQYGGALYFFTYNSGVQLFNTTFHKNTAVHGGALYLSLQNGITVFEFSNNNFNISSSNFIGNHATNLGGALYSDQQNIILIKDTNFTGNTALQGGGIHGITNTTLIFTSNNRFEYNYAKNEGGAISLVDSKINTINESTHGKIINMSHNIAERGSAAYFEDANNKYNEYKLNDVLFYHNNATAGGTIYWLDNTVTTSASGDKGKNEGFNFSMVQFDNNKARYGNQVATQGLSVDGPRKYTVEVYNRYLFPSINFTVRDYYDQVVHHHLRINPSIVDYSNPQCYLSGPNSGGLIGTNGIFIFNQLEAHCYPTGELQVGFDVVQLNNDKSTSDLFSQVVTFVFRSCYEGEIIVKGSCVPCSSGSYSLEKNINDQTECIDCTNIEGVQKCFSDSIYVKKKYWRRHEYSKAVIQCLSTIDGCNGGYSTGDASCRIGYRGPLCASCSDGYYNDGIQCITCSNTVKHFNTASIVYICILGIIILTVITYTTLKYYFKLDFVKYTKRSLTKFYSQNIIQAKIVIVTYQVIGATQNALLVQFPYLFARLSNALNAFLLDISVLFPFSCQYSHYNFIDKLIFMTILPVAITIVLWLIFIGHYQYVITHLRPTKSKLIMIDRIFHELKNRYLTYFFFMTYLILPSVTTNLFQMFICTNVDPNNEDADHNYYLTADVRIPCYTSYWYNGVIYSSMFILVYPVGIPLMYFYLLYKYKMEIISRVKETNDLNKDNKIKQQSDVTPVTVIYDNNSSNSPNSPVDEERKLPNNNDSENCTNLNQPNEQSPDTISIVIQNNDNTPIDDMNEFGADDKNIIINPPDGDKSDSDEMPFDNNINSSNNLPPLDDAEKEVSNTNNAIVHESDSNIVHNESSKKTVTAITGSQTLSYENKLSPEALSLQFLWEPHKNDYWYWEVVECYRRIILTSVLSVISPGSALQSLVAVLFSLFFIKLYLYFTPYELHSDNTLAEIGQYQIFATFFIALIINNSLLGGNAWAIALGN